VTGLTIKVDLTDAKRAFRDLDLRQLPFATSLALNALASGVRTQEKDDVVETFDAPTPFTVNAFAIAAATKAKPIATVFAKDVQATYLTPYVLGGERSLGTKKAMLVPRVVGTNQYGNLTRGKLKSLKGKPDVFIGAVRFRRSGKTVSGVWQRPAYGERKDGGRGTKGNTRRNAVGVSTGLTLLIQFEDTTPAPKRLDFYERAGAYVTANAGRAFDDAIARALATARK